MRETLINVLISFNYCLPVYFILKYSEIRYVILLPPFLLLPCLQFSLYFSLHYSFHFSSSISPSFLPRSNSRCISLFIFPSISPSITPLLLVFLPPFLLPFLLAPWRRCSVVCVDRISCVASNTTQTM